MLVLTWLVAFAPTLSRPRWVVNQIRCASNLRQIGQAMLLYANENGGQYPGDFDALLLTQDIAPKIFVCPGSTDTPVAGASPAQWAAGLRSGGHLSYVYTARGQTPKNPPAAVLAYEADGHHGPASDAAVHGRNFLYADCSVKYLPPAAANHAINELAAGFNPPRP